MKKYRLACAAMLACAAISLFLTACGRDLGAMTTAPQTETVLITMRAEEFYSMMEAYGGDLPVITQTQAPTTAP